MELIHLINLGLPRDISLLVMLYTKDSIISYDSNYKTVIDNKKYEGLLLNINCNRYIKFIQTRSKKCKGNIGCEIVSLKGSDIKDIINSEIKSIEYDVNVSLPFKNKLTEYIPKLSKLKGKL